jgi:hypothetical protein
MNVIMEYIVSEWASEWNKIDLFFGSRRLNMIEFYTLALQFFLALRLSFSSFSTLTHIDPPYTDFTFSYTMRLVIRQDYDEVSDWVGKWNEQTYAWSACLLTISSLSLSLSFSSLYQGTYHSIPTFQRPTICTGLTKWLFPSRMLPKTGEIL